MIIHVTIVDGGYLDDENSFMNSTNNYDTFYMIYDSKKKQQ